MVAEALLIAKFFTQMDSAISTIRPSTTVSTDEQVKRKLMTLDSFADFNRAILKCYHPTAQYRSADIVERPWKRQNQYGATKSVLVQIRYVGVSSRKYTMFTGVLAKEDAFRAVVVEDNAKIRAISKCGLQEWVKAGQ